MFQADSPTFAPFDRVASDMQAVDQAIATSLSSDVPLIAQVCQYIITAGGKRLRPALLLLTCSALGCKDSRRFALAALIEFIHTATLLHDDVVDGSVLRRGRATSNQIFGNPASVLVGDFLYSRAFQMMVENGDMRVMSILADATNVIAQGEVEQLMNIRDVSLDEARYLRVIRSKTARLFEASAQLAAVLAGCGKVIEDACAVFGQALGTAFQIVDDILDYSGDAAQMGKNLGDDLREGKVTLPLIAAIQRSSPAQRIVLQQAIETGDNEKLDEIIAILKTTGAIDISRAAANAEVKRALDATVVLPLNPYTEALRQLAAQLLARHS